MTCDAQGVVSLQWMGTEYNDPNGEARYLPAGGGITFSDGSNPGNGTPKNTSGATFSQSSFSPDSIHKWTIRRDYSSPDENTLLIITTLTNNASTLSITGVDGGGVFPVSLAAIPKPYTTGPVGASYYGLYFVTPAVSITCFETNFSDYWTFKPDRSTSCGFTNTQNTGPITNSSTLAPGASKALQMYIRFGAVSASPSRMQAEMLAALHAVFPEHAAHLPARPTARWFLADTGHASATNPRGWFNAPSLNALDIPTFQSALKSAVAGELAALNALPVQPFGVLIWDHEGEQFSQPGLTYAGNPPLMPYMAPEMDASIDADLMAPLHAAGYAVGLTLRPQHVLSGTSLPATCNYSSTPSGVGFIGNSSTPLTIGTGMQTLTTQTGMSWRTNNTIRLASASLALDYMEGTVTSYASGTGSMTVNITYAVGSGTFSTWNVIGAQLSDYTDHFLLYPSPNIPTKGDPTYWVCLSDGQSWSQSEAQGAQTSYQAIDDVVSELSAKATYAISRYGADFFYVDSTVWSGGAPMNFQIWQQLSVAFPGVTFIPEEWNENTNGFASNFADAVQTNVWSCGSHRFLYPLGNCWVTVSNASKALLSAGYVSVNGTSVLSLQGAGFQTDSGTVATGGSGYKTGDTGTIRGCGNGLGTYTVTASAGAVTKITVSLNSSYTSATACSTIVSTGSGDGSLTISLTTWRGATAYLAGQPFTISTVTSTSAMTLTSVAPTTSSATFRTGSLPATIFVGIRAGDSYDYTVNGWNEYALTAIYQEACGWHFRGRVPIMECAR